MGFIGVMQEEPYLEAGSAQRDMNTILLRGPECRTKLLDMGPVQTVIGIEEQPSFIVIFVIVAQQTLENGLCRGRAVPRFHDVNLDSRNPEEVEVLLRSVSVIARNDKKPVVPEDLLVAG